MVGPCGMLSIYSVMPLPVFMSGPCLAWHDLVEYLKMCRVLEEEEFNIGICM